MYKKLLALIPLALSIAFSVSAQSNVGLIAHWPFNGNVNDSTGNGHNGTAYNIASDSGITGKPSTAYRFNGSTSYVSAPYKADLNLAKYSICTIVKPKGFYAGACQGNVVIARGSESTAGCYGMEYFDNAFDNNNCGLRDTTKNVFAGCAGTITDNGIMNNFQYTPTISVNTWYSVVNTFDGGTVKVFVDGVLKSTYPTTGGSMGTSTDGISIGSSYVNTGSVPFWLNGMLDDLRIYNRVLADSEIKQYVTKIYMTKGDTACRTSSYLLNAKLVNGNLIQTTGNVFTAELSDLSGSFASPLTIGTYTVGSSGTINTVSIPCTLPSSVSVGAYKLRIKTAALGMYSEAGDLYVTASATAPTASLTSSASTTTPIGATITFTATTANVGSSPTFKWFRNGALIPGVTGNTYTGVAGTNFANSDIICVVVNTSLTCSVTDTASSCYTVALGIADSNKEAAFNIFPNPNNGSFTLKGRVANSSSMKLDVLNTVGQVIYSENLVINNSFVNREIKLTGISNGIYFVKLNADGITTTIRLVVAQ